MVKGFKRTRGLRKSKGHAVFDKSVSERDKYIVTSKPRVFTTRKGAKRFMGRRKGLKIMKY